MLLLLLPEAYTSEGVLGMIVPPHISILLIIQHIQRGGTVTKELL